MSVGIPVGEPGVLMRNTSWQQYVELRDSNEHRHVRMTFDRGELELMSPTRLHERLNFLIGHCIIAWVEEMRIPFQGCGSTTFRREDLQRGLEPDNCYYIENESAVRERDEVDLTIDPPPDLVVEVDVTSSSIDRIPIYVALGVPEIWRWHNDTLHVLVLSPDTQYVEVGASRALPGFPFERMVEMLKRRNSSDGTTLIREFRGWCRPEHKN
jgi:Uma2 family endonuclease